MAALICAIFFISGLSALIFEALWFRQAGLAFGSSIWASSLVLSGFMGGLAAGNALAARYGDRLRNPVRAYAMAELAIAPTGIGIVYLLPSLGVALAPWLGPLLDQPWLLNPLRLLITFLVLLIPSTAMGVTLPLLTKTLMAYDSRFGSVLGKLYGWNTLGAVVGAVLGEIYLVALWGVRGTALAAGALNMLAGGCALWLSRQPLHQPLDPPDHGRAARHRWFGGAGRPWLMAAFLSGFCLLALEVIWFRLLLLFVMGQAVAFALMLAIVLAGIALGGLAASHWLRRSPDADRFSGALAVTAGLVCLACYAAFPLVIEPFETSQILRPVEILQVGVPLLLPVSLISGVFFTVVGAGLRRSLVSASETTGVLTLANTAGAALGSLVGGFILLPVLGIERSVLFVALVYAGIGALLWLNSPVSRRSAYAMVAALLIGVAIVPFTSVEQRLFNLPVKRFASMTQSGGNATATVAALREGLTETLMYLEIPLAGRPMYHAMFMNSVMMAHNGVLARRYMKLYVYWPVAVHPNLKRALLLGYGIGNTAKAMTDSDLEEIDVVDISRDVLEMSHVIYPDESERPLSDPRVRVHVEDGRYFLQTTEQRFDLITAEPPPPRSAAAVNLYTREYFQLLYNRLAEGGIVTYWLPLHAVVSEVSAKAILRAFCDAFDDCSLWNAIGTQLMMVGTRHAEGPVSEEVFSRQWHDPVVGAEMRQLGFEQPEQLGALFIGDAAYVDALITDARPLVDDDPRLIEAPVESPAEADRLVGSFRDVAAARERFRQSPLITRLWPQRLRAASLPYFGVQDIINRYGYLSPPAGIEDAHRLLTGSPLRTLVGWLLGSNADAQRIVTAAEPAELAQPALQFHLGIRLIAEQQYGLAVEPLRRAEASAQFRTQAFGFGVYTLCMSAQLVEAQRLVDERSRSLDKTAPFWLWMRRTFGLRL